MTENNRISASTQGSRDKSVQAGDTVSPELTQDELNNVCGGAVDAFIWFEKPNVPSVIGEK
jgi:hypothetical protein